MLEFLIQLRPGLMKQMKKPVKSCLIEAVDGGVKEGGIPNISDSSTKHAQVFLSFLDFTKES